MPTIGEFIKAVEEAEQKRGKEKIEFGKNYIIGYDLAAPNGKDYSAVSMLCCNCNTIIHMPKKCPCCGVRFEPEVIIRALKIPQQVSKSP